MNNTTRSTKDNPNNHAHPELARSRRRDRPYRCKQLSTLEGMGIEEWRMEQQAKQQAQLQTPSPPPPPPPTSVQQVSTEEKENMDHDAPTAAKESHHSTPDGRVDDDVSRENESLKTAKTRLANCKNSSSHHLHGSAAVLSTTTPTRVLPPIAPPTTTAATAA